MNIYNLSFLLLFPFMFLITDNQQKLNKNKPGVANIVFKSTDGGQSWQNISKGLPENLREDGIKGNTIVANDYGLYLLAGNGIYYSNPNSKDPFWKKEIFPEGHSIIAPGKSRIFYWGINLKTTNGTSVWSPIFENFQEPRIRSVFETAGGTIFIGIDRGIFKTDNSGKNWKLVYAGGLVGHLAESDGVLLSISMRKIIRSTDNGESWAPVTSEDSVTWDIKPIKGGFVAITSTSETGTRRLSTSYDGGKTWQSIHSSLRNKAVIDSIWQTWNDRPIWQAFQTSIIQVGENFFCTHRNGIFRSSDKGKTWTLLLPSVDDKGFNLFISGNVIYAIRSKGGC